MRGIKEFLDEKKIHLVFEVSLWLKGTFALTEVLGGVAAFVVPQQLLVHIANVITQGELTEDPHDLVANYLLHSAQHLSIGAQHFTGLYLMSHGVIKLWLIVGLLRERLWYYPTGMVVFSLFIIYQLYRFTSTQSLWLLFITAVDIVVIGLTWHEYGYVRRHLEERKAQNG